MTHEFVQIFGVEKNIQYPFHKTPEKIWLLHTHQREVWQSATLKEDVRDNKEGVQVWSSAPFPALCRGCPAATEEGLRE